VALRERRKIRLRITNSCSLEDESVIVEKKGETALPARQVRKEALVV